MDVYDYSKQWLLDNQIRIKQVYVKSPGDYDRRFIYMNRIANYSKPKFRILKKGEHVKNCLMITFNTERHNKTYLEYLIQSKIRAITQWSHGSCHIFINKGILGVCLSGILNERAQVKRELLNT